MPTIFLDYLPAELCENKRWYIQYYIKNPVSGKLHRKCIKINRIKAIKERRKYGKRLVSELNKKLEEGWNPFLEQESAKAYHNIYDVFDTYLNIKNKELREQSMKSYKSNMNLLKQFLFKLDPSKKMFAIGFNSMLANDFLNYMYVDRNVSEVRYNGMLVFGKNVFNWMLQYSYVKANPFDGIKKKKEKDKKRKVIPAEARTEIKDYLLKTDVEFLVFLMIEFHSLLRPKEILNLRISDIDLDNQVISVSKENAKNGKFRLATIPDVLLDYIKLLGLQIYDKNLYVFSDKLQPGKNLKLTKFPGQRWSKLRKDLGFKNEYQMYSLRDSGIINLLQSGVSPEEVAKQAGHSDLSITSLYALHANKEANEQIKNKSKKF